MVESMLIDMTKIIVQQLKSNFTDKNRENSELILKIIPERLHILKITEFMKTFIMFIFQITLQHISIYHKLNMG